MSTLMMQANKAADSVRAFLSARQWAAMSALCKGEEGEFFAQKFIDLAQQIDTMPKTYQQSGEGDQAIVHLHYFLGGSDWYITEKDVEGGVEQAYGYACLNGLEDMAESGFISIAEITQYGAELDLHWTPRSLAEVKALLARRARSWAA